MKPSLILTTLLMSLAPAVLHAAEAPRDPTAQVRTIYDEGFTMVGEDDSLKIGAWMQNDVRVFFKGHPSRDQFLVRRACGI